MNSPPLTRAGMAVFVFVAGLFIAARLWHLTTFVLDGDEIFSLQAARMSWADLISLIVNDVVHPPLFYLLLKVWVAVGGESLFWLRLFPTLIAMAAIVPVFFICRELKLRDTETNLVIMLMAVNGYLVYYSNHLRMYSLLMFLSLCSFWLFIKFFNAETGSKKLLILLFAVNLLLIYAHYYGLLVVGLEALFLLLWKHPKSLSFLISSIFLGVCFSPWVYAVAQAAKRKRGLGQNLDWVTRPDVSNLTWFYGTLNGLFDFRRSTSLGLLLFGFPVVLWAWYALKGARGESRKECVITLSWLLVFSFLPVALAFFVSQWLAQSVWGERHLIIVAAPYLILVSVAAHRLRPVWLRTAVLLLLMGWACVAGFKAQTRGDKSFAWDVMVSSMSQAEPAPDHLKVYAFEGYVATPLQFYLDAAHESRFQVVLVSDIGALEGTHFWVAFREATWRHDRLPQENLIEKGYQVGEGFRSKKSDQQVQLFPVWRR